MLNSITNLKYNYFILKRLKLQSSRKNKFLLITINLISLRDYGININQLSQDCK